MPRRHRKNPVMELKSFRKMGEGIFHFSQTTRTPAQNLWIWYAWSMCCFCQKSPWNQSLNTPAHIRDCGDFLKRDKTPNPSSNRIYRSPSPTPQTSPAKTFLRLRDPRHPHKIPWPERASITLLHKNLRGFDVPPRNLIPGWELPKDHHLTDKNSW